MIISQNDRNLPFYIFRSRCMKKHAIIVANRSVGSLLILTAINFSYTIGLVLNFNILIKLIKMRVRLYDFSLLDEFNSKNSVHLLHLLEKNELE